MSREGHTFEKAWIACNEGRFDAQVGHRCVMQANSMQKMHQPITQQSTRATTHAANV